MPTSESEEPSGPERDGKPPQGKAAEDRTSDERATDGRATDGRASNESEAEPGDLDSHDPDGLDLARTVARSLAGTRPARRGRGARGRGSIAGGNRRGRRTDPRASGAHPDERDPQTLDSTIGRLVSEQGWAGDVRVHGVFARWDMVVGREVAQHCRPESYAEGRLVVRTDSTAWATQVRMLAPTVLARLNEELGDGMVTFIEVRGPVGPSWTKGARSVRDGRGPRDTYG